MAAKPTSLSQLKAPLALISALLEGFHMAPHPDQLPPPHPDHPLALALLHDAAKLLEAQVTKFTLLLTNAPFTASEIAIVLNFIASGCLPALMSIPKMLSRKQCSFFLYTEIANQMKSFVLGLQGLMLYNPVDETGVRTLLERKGEVEQAFGRVRDACQRLTRIANRGIVGLAEQITDDVEGTIQDAIEELRQWDPTADDETMGWEDGDGDSDSPLSEIQDDDHTAQISKKEESRTAPMTPNGVHYPKAMGHIPEIKAKVLQTIQLVHRILPPYKLHRATTFPSLTRTTSMASLPKEHQLRTLDKQIEILKRLSDETDAVAETLYETVPERAVTNPEKVFNALDVLRASAENLAVDMRNGWDGKEDRFSAEVLVWLKELKALDLRVLE